MNILNTEAEEAYREARDYEGAIRGYTQEEFAKATDWARNYTKREYAARISELEIIITYMLDDEGCDLYRDQAAKAIGYRKSFSGKGTEDKITTEIDRLRGLLQEADNTLISIRVNCPKEMNSIINVHNKIAKELQNE